MSLEEFSQIRAVGEGLLSDFHEQLIPRDYCMHGFLSSPLPHRKAHYENLVTCTVDAQEMSTRSTTELLPSGANMHLAVVAVNYSALYLD